MNRITVDVMLITLT